MYNPFDENNTTNNAKDNEPLEQDTAKEEEPVNASQPGDARLTRVPLHRQRGKG